MIHLIVFIVLNALLGLHAAVYRPEFDQLKRQVQSMKTGLCGDKNSVTVPKTHILRFGGTMDGADSDTVDAYFPNEPSGTNFFQLNTRMPKARSRFGLERMGNKIYIFGGSRLTSELSDVDAYNINKVSTKLNTFTERESMKSHKSGMATALLPVTNKILVCGGLFGLRTEADCEIYDPVSNQWTEGDQIQNLPSPKAGAVGVTFNNFVYMLGGGDTQNPRTPSNEVFRYHVNYNTWQPVKQMTEQRIYAAACALGDWIYICGGLGDDLTAIKSCEKYNPIDDSWTSISEMTIAGAKMNSGLSLLDYNGQLLAVHEESVEKYDSHTDEWTVLPGTLNERKNFAAIAI